MDETAATPISENSSRIASVFANTDATSQMQDVNAAMQANSNSTTSTATGDIKLAPSTNPKSKAPLIIIALLVLAGVGALVWATVTGRLGGGGSETGNVTAHTTLEEVRKSFDRFATYVLFGTSEDTLDDIYNPNKEYRIETESYAESYNAEFWDEAMNLLSFANNEYSKTNDVEQNVTQSLANQRNTLALLSSNMQFKQDIESNILTKVIANGSSATIASIADAYNQFMTIPDERIVEYATTVKAEYSALVDLYDVYVSKGCVTNNENIDEGCIAQLSEDELENVETLAYDFNISAQNARSQLQEIVDSFVVNCYRISGMLVEVPIEEDNLQ